jgi:hypothetical protein
MKPILYTYTLDVGRLRQEGQCFAGSPEGVVHVVAERFADTWLTYGVPAKVSVREVGSTRIRPCLVQEVRA